MASKIGKKEWTIVYIVMGVLDFIQFVIIELVLVWFFGIGIAINEFMDPVVGILFALYLFIRGVGVAKYWKNYASILGMEFLEEVTGGVTQLWVLDVWYIKGNIQKMENAEKAQKEKEMMLQNIANQPLNEDGTRLPETRTTTGTSGGNGRIITYNAGPLNVNGVRAAMNTQIRTSTGTNRSNASNPVVKSGVSK